MENQILDELTLVKCDYIMFVEKTRASCDALVNLCNKKLEIHQEHIDKQKKEIERLNEIIRTNKMLWDI